MRKKRYRYQKSYRIKRKKSLLKKGFVWPSLLAFLCLSGLFYFFFLSPFFQIEEVSVSGEQKVSRDGVLSSIGESLGKQILFFKTKSIFLVNAAEIREAILAAFPQISGVVFSRELPGTLKVQVIEREPRAVWCGRECHLMDAEGVIFEKTEAGFLGLVEVKVSRSSAEAELGERIVDSGILSLILKIKSEIESGTGLRIKEAREASRDRLDFRTNEGWEIYFNTEKDIEWQIQKLSLVLEKEISPEKRKTLEYIDLRFTRVYYK
jgi:cell division septal protein FtsQ